LYVQGETTLSTSLFGFFHLSQIQDEHEVGLGTGHIQSLQSFKRSGMDCVFVTMRLGFEQKTQVLKQPYATVDGRYCYMEQLKSTKRLRNVFPAVISSVPRSSTETGMWPTNVVNEQ
jgi:hypothetical protein